MTEFAVAGVSGMITVMHLLPKCGMTTLRHHIRCMSGINPNSLTPVRRRARGAGWIGCIATSIYPTSWIDTALAQCLIVP